MEFGTALTYPFEDEDWLKKLLIGLVIGYIPIVNFALSGWQVRLIRNVKNNDPTPLPAWDDFGGHFSKGLMAGIAWFIYQLPVLLVICVATLASGGIGGLISGEAAQDAGGALGAGLTVVLACCGCIALIYGIVAFAAYFGGLIRFAETETFSTFMEFGTNFGLVRANLGQFLMALLYIAAVLIVLNIIPLANLLTPIVLAYFAGHILGQLSQQLQEGGEMAAAAA